MTLMDDIEKLYGLDLRDELLNELQNEQLDKHLDKNHGTHA